MSVVDDLLQADLSPSQMVHAIVGILKRIYYQERKFHLPVVSPSRSQIAGGTTPTINRDGPLLSYEFTLDVDEVFRFIKIPRNMVRDAAFHVHWTKADDVDRQGQTVRWVVDYSVANGFTDVANEYQHTVEITDEYLSDETTGRTIHGSADFEMVGVQAGYYLAMRVRALTPGSGTPVANPCLVALDATWIERINDDPTD